MEKDTKILPSRSTWVWKERWGEDPGALGVEVKFSPLDHRILTIRRDFQVHLVPPSVQQHHNPNKPLHSQGPHPDSCGKPPVVYHSPAGRAVFKPQPRWFWGKEATDKKAKCVTGNVLGVTLFGREVAWLLSLENLLWEGKHHYCSIELHGEIYDLI